MKQIIFTTILALIFSFSVFAQNTSSLCAKIEVTGGAVVQPGEPMNFTAKVTGTTENSPLEYEWKISAGKLTSGQGTNSISIDTTESAGQNITAEVIVKGLSANCANKASEIGSVAQKLPMELFDEYGKMPDNEVKVHVQNMYVELGNTINYQGYIINYGTDKELANRERQIRRAVNFLKLDSYRITLVRGEANPNGAGVLTKVWLLPPGAELPQP